MIMREITVAISIPVKTAIAARIMFVACVPRVSKVQFLDIVIKLSAGQNTHMTSFDNTLPALFGTMFVFLVVKPMAMQKNIVSTGVSVVKNASNILTPDNCFCVLQYIFYHFMALMSIKSSDFTLCFEVLDFQC